MSLKVQRVAQIIKREVSQIIQFEVHNPNIGMLTVTGVDLSGDLSIAKIYVTSLGKANIDEVLANLKKSKGFIRSTLGSRLSIRKCPDLIFLWDDSLKQGNHIEDLLDNLKK